MSLHDWLGELLEFHVLIENVLVEREEVNPAIWLATSRRIEVEVRRICAAWYPGQEQGGNEPYSSWSPDEIFEVWIALYLLLSG